MADLYNQLVSDTPIQYGQVQHFEPLNDTALNDDWAIPTLVSGGLRVVKSIPFLPYIKDIWNGRKLLFHKPFDEMTSEEYNLFGKKGKSFYKNYLHNSTAKHRDIGNISFPNSQAGKADYRYMEKYPLLVEDIMPWIEIIILID